MPIDCLVGECDMFQGIMDNLCSAWPSENCSIATLALKISLTSISKWVRGVSVVFYLHYFGCKEKKDEKAKAGEEEPIPLFGNENGRSNSVSAHNFTLIKWRQPTISAIFVTLLDKMEIAHLSFILRDEEMNLHCPFLRK